MNSLSSLVRAATSLEAVILPAHPPATFASAKVQAGSDGITVRIGDDTYEIQIVAPNVVRVHFEPKGRSTPRTQVIDPAASFHASGVRIDTSSNPMTLATDQLVVKVAKSPVSIEVDDTNGKILRATSKQIKSAELQLDGAHAGSFYGIENTSLAGGNQDRRQDIRNGVYRVGGTFLAGFQGDGAAPLVYTKRYGVLVDSDGGSVDITGSTLAFHKLSRPDVEFFAIAGPPKATMRAVVDISGRPPMMPKWSLGFMNSQWRSTESEVRQLVDTYRAKNIPIDAFILDFDWKAWGEDDYGELRWNSTSGPGNTQPDKFPNGASGKFAADLLTKGVKLAGIFKPRILMTNAAGQPDQAAAFATAHNLFFPWQPPYPEYYSGRNARDIDFSIPLARRWYWEHTLPAYRAGIIAFWNDEADATDSLGLYPNFQFANMQRSLYEGVRSIDGQRVFSLNRNFYLGAQRYAYGEWSGDIEGGFDSMREQAIRMLGAVDLGESHWAMDTGGFFGHPSPENYARWMQFAAFVPVMRVHGYFNEKRQPWVYGAQAERVATDAIDLRYALLPYHYSLEREAHETGVGIVRPLVWEFPYDADAVYQTDEWMDGEALLVAPVFGEGQSHRDVYLPEGTWYDYFRGTRYEGKTTIDYRVDPQTWADIPLFVRAGSIVATQDVQQWVGQSPVTNVRLDVFPSKQRAATFDYYDDDGATYAYEHGAYFKQQISVTSDAAGVHIASSTPTGSYVPALKTYTIVVHGLGNTADRFGPVTTLVIPAAQAYEHTLPGELAVPEGAPHN